MYDAFRIETRRSGSKRAAIVTRLVEDSMRQLSLLCVLLLLCGFAAAQATVIGGTAGNWAPAYGVYAAPYVPLITTPSVTLTTVSPSPVGASNATFGLVAGATNATLSDEFIASPPVGVYTQPVWYGPSPEGLTWYNPSAAAPEPMHHRMHGENEGGFDFIAAGQDSQGVARLLGTSARAGKASRTYTNQDIDQVNQKNGTVKWDGKTQKL